MGIAKYSEDNLLLRESRLRQRDLRLHAKPAADAKSAERGTGDMDKAKKQGGTA